MSSDESSGRPQVGNICWLEIPIKDPDRALSFYRGVFGWDCNEEGQDSPADPGVLKRYFFSSKTKSTNGCFIQVEPKNLLAPSLAPNNETKERWAVINSFAVENIDNTLDNIERIGGRVYWPKTEIGNDMGFYARFVDTEGNVHGLWSMHG